ncbi:MAG TPA: FtsW/RodA/SpoVE family cell cycle protein [Oscillospiraceae bacterium]|nr:FtsW/RodA/SpoVE family cell cycle protein [Oscillospiraceae bacterium]
MSRVLRSFTDYIKRADKLFWLISIAIAIYGLILVKSVSRATEVNYFKTQLIAVLIGYAVAIFLTLIDYRAIANYWWLIAGFCIFLIIYTRIFGIAAEGGGGVNAKAWIKIPGGTFQPSELVKIGFLITFSKHLSVLKENDLLKRPLQILLLGAHALIPIALVHQQGDDGAGVIFFCMFLAMAFAAGVQLRYFAGLFAAILIAVPLAWKYVLQDYQKSRFTIVYNLASDPLGKGLQQLQGQLSIGSGQFWGRGLFNGPRVERGNVPIQQSDFIFSVAGEELGFIGCTLIILLLFLLLIRTLHDARKSCDSMGTYICFGFFGMIAAQAIFNLGMCLNLLPVMGVTLPFFSAGGSSAMCLYFGFGLVQNVYMHRNDGEKVKVKIHR